MTNAEKIIALLSKSPGLDDDEISSHTRISPRQQVNQICRRLESKGQIRRVVGPHGKVVNYLAGSRHYPATDPQNVDEAHDGAADQLRHGSSDEGVRRPRIDSSELDDVASLDLSSTLILIPCSGRKIRIGDVRTGSSITEILPRPLSQELQKVRKRVSEESFLDESTLLPAWQRYSGTLYQSAKPNLNIATNKGQKLAIISGCYGLVLATEPIGWYDHTFKCSDWPNAILERALLQYIREKEIENVVAIVSSSTAYRAFLSQVDWNETNLKYVFFIMPETSKGAMVKAPRAQGEALSALLNRTLNSSFQSSDALRMEIQHVMIQ